MSNKINSFNSVDDSKTSGGRPSPKDSSTKDLDKNGVSRPGDSSHKSNSNKKASSLNKNSKINSNDDKKSQHQSQAKPNKDGIKNDKNQSSQNGQAMQDGKSNKKDNNQSNQGGNTDMSNKNINPFNADDAKDQNGSQNGNGSNNGGNQGGNPNPQMMTMSAPEPEPTDFLIDYKKLAQEGKIEHAQFRDAEVNALLSVLNTIKHPNALLVGEAGVGKTQLVEELALQIEKDGSPAQQTLGKETHIYELPISLLVGGTGIAGSLEKRVNAIVKFASDPENHAIIFIDEIHQLFTNKGSQSESITQALKPALARNDMHVIGATTTNESRELKSDPAFNRRFTSITVRELNNEQTLEILKTILPTYNKKHNLATGEAILPTVLEMANKYLKDSSRPDTALTLLDQASSLIDIRQKQNNLTKSSLTEQHIKDAVMQLLNTTAPKLDAKRLAKTLSTKILGQDYAVDNIIDSLKRYALGLKFDNKPTSFLLAGPTGTGKSELAKQISQSLFTEPNSLITLNMTEYTNESSINRLLGSDTGYVGSTSHEARPLDGLRRNPFQVVLLDEFEKSHPAIQRVFMQALDEGFILDHHNQRLDFSHAIVIATTNAGVTELNKSSIGFANHSESASSLHDNHAIIDILSKSYPIELLNRFAHVISFNSIDKNTYKQILKLNYNELVPEIKKQMHMNVEPAQLDMDSEYDFINELADASYDPLYNARPAKRTMISLFEDCLISNTQPSIVNINQEFANR